MNSKITDRDLLCKHAGSCGIEYCNGDECEHYRELDKRFWKDRTKKAMEDLTLVQAENKRLRTALDFIADQHNKGKAGNWAVNLAITTLKGS